jgi:3-hydroxy acid dehydrogenase/malonic semialdehyde reductase
MAERILRPGAVALVTGASTGIGEALAVMLVERGVRVICAAREPKRLSAVVARLGQHAHALQLDIADPASAAGLLERLPEELREIDILVNNAGHDAGGRKLFHEGAVEDWAGIIETNVTGLIRVTHAVLPGMAGA